MSKHLNICFFFALFICRTSFAGLDTLSISEDTNKINKSNLEELLLESSLEDSEDSKLLDYLDDLERNPLDLNTVTQEELETIPFVSSILAKDIIDYRNKNFPLKSKRELLNVDATNEQLYEMIKIYFVVRKSGYEMGEEDSEKTLKENKREKFRLIKNLELRYSSRFQQDLQTKEAYLSGDYPGSKAKIYNQLNFTYTNEKYLFKGNLTLEKDPGENSITDFSSGYLELKNYKYIKSAVVGDYSLTFGQGLGMWSGLGFSKGGAAVDPVKKRGGGISGYSSVNESQFFRGAAVDVNYKYFDFIFFYSNNYFDASIDTTLDEISSFYFDGYHRTISENNRKNSAKEFLFGSRAYYNKENLRIGVTYWTSKFSKPVGEDNTKQLYSFSGGKANMLSVDYDFLYKNINLYGEFARSQSGSIAGIGALRFSIGKVANLVFLYRNYPEDFSPVHSFGFGEKNGNTQNESGFYSGLSFAPIKGLQVNAYYDQFKFPYRSYSDPTAIAGNDFLTNIIWSANKNVVIDFRYKNENKEESRTVPDEFGRDVKKIDNRNQMNFRVGFDYEISNRFRVRSRYDYVFVRYTFYGGNNKGNLFYTDLRFMPLSGLTFSTRFIFFDTEDYDSRIYEYEDDIRGVMSNNGLYGKGRRWYA
ncbi:MAG: helix-hairpin-helix domain-containing protein, partial [Ignavibacteria bacterium]